jgi:hypothetical protein
MKHWIAGIATLWMALAGVAMAEDGKRPVILVELFTSQGCSSCPPADEFLHKLAKRDDVIALSLHVDYWDYIGWKDVFADHRYTLRQHGYAQAGKRRSVYTPQMIIHGQDHVVGNHPMDVSDLIRTYQKRAQPVALSVERQGTQVVIRAKGGTGKGPMLVQMVRYEPRAMVDIRRGENAGRKLSYANVVREWNVIGEWDGRAPLEMKARARGKLPMAIVVQHKGFGPVVAAARVD